MKNWERQINPVKSQEIPKIDELKIEITPEQEEVLDSAIKFAEYLTGYWPQIDTGREYFIETEDNKNIKWPPLPAQIETKPKINYYLSGSLASMLLSQADKFYEIDESQFPIPITTTIKKIPETAGKILSSLARPIGDLDYVPTDYYKNNPARLRKGGGGPSFEEPPIASQKILKREKKQLKIMCDPVENYGTNKVARINIRGRDYYITRPDTILAYKILHLLQSYEQKPEKFNVDFDKLFESLKQVYSEDELLQTTHQVLVDYEQSMKKLHTDFADQEGKTAEYEEKIPRFIKQALANPHLSSNIRTILEKLRL